MRHDELFSNWKACAGVGIFWILLGLYTMGANDSSKAPVGILMIFLGIAIAGYGIAKK